MWARKRKGFGWKRWSRRWLRDTLGLFGAFGSSHSRYDERRCFDAPNTTTRSGDTDLLLSPYW